MSSKLWLKEIKSINVEGGYLIDGFPSVGFTSAIASESLMHSSKYEIAGFIDSLDFPAVTIIKDGTPNYATRIFVNSDLKVAIFTSYLTMNESFHRSVAKTMLLWAKKHKCQMILSSAPMNMPDEKADQVIAAGSTSKAREKIKNAGMKVLQNGTIPGIPGILLNEASVYCQDVIVILVNVDESGPDFKASVNLCMALSKLLPGVSCDLELLQKQAVIAEKQFKDTEKETRSIKESMYG